MNDVAMTGVGGYHTLGGVQLHLTPLTPRDFAEARIFLRSITPDPMEGIVEQCNALHDSEVAKKLIDKAYEAREKWGSLSSTDGKMWANSPDGTAFFLYRQTRKHHPEITMEWLTAECRQVGLKAYEAIQEAIARISGLTKSNPTKGTTLKQRKQLKKRKTK